MLPGLGFLAAAAAAGPWNITVVSERPRIVVVDGFLEYAEAARLVAAGWAGQGGGGQTGVVTAAGDIRTLRGTATSQISRPPAAEPAIADLAARIRTLLPIPERRCEPFHMLRYGPGDFFRAHLDAHALRGRPTSSRVATCLVYLSDVVAGGETWFPAAVPAGPAPDPPPGGCAGLDRKDRAVQGKDANRYYDGTEFEDGNPTGGATGVVVRPRAGRAVLWWNKTPDGKVDLRARHVGCPVEIGEKWAATRWMHDRDLGRETRV